MTLLNELIENISKMGIKMKSNEIGKQYGELRKKYKLPVLKEIDMEFEISDLEQTSFLLRAIIRRIAEKLDFYTTIVEETLQPDTAKLYAIHESRVFDDEEKKEMYDFYKELMIISRKSIEVSLHGSEKEEASFINEFMNDWEKIKSRLLSYVKKMKDSWKAETDIKEDLEYLG